MSSLGPSAHSSLGGKKRNYKEVSSSEPETSLNQAQKAATASTPQPHAKKVKVTKENGGGQTEAPARAKTSNPTNGTAKKARKKEWDAWVDAHEWLVDKKYKHPNQPFMYTQRDALKFIKDKLEPKLNQRELDTLRFEQRRSQFEGFRASHMYSVVDIYALVKRKAEALDKPLVLPRPSPFDNWWNPEVPPLIIHEYTPPKNAHPDDPPPEAILWDGEHFRHRNLLLKDACILYCLQEGQLKDLADHSKWLDAKTVAMRAVRLHGGVKHHNEIVVARRVAAQKFIEGKQTAAWGRRCDGQPSERYSDYLEEQIELGHIYRRGLPATFHLPWYDRCESRDKLFDEPDPIEGWTPGQRTVKQFAPLLELYQHPAFPDHGTYWLHHGGRYIRWDYDFKA